MNDQPASQTLGASDWISVTQPLIDAFADATGDRQFIHTDPVRAAAETPFGGTIAHGFLTLSLLPAMAAAVLPRRAARMNVNYGFNKVRFITPVRSGARIRGVFTLASDEETKPGVRQMIVHVSVEIEGEARPALVAEWLTQSYA